MKGFTLIELIIVFIIFAILGFVWAAPFLSFPADVAKIEAVREAVKDVSNNESEDIFGQAVDINKRISEKIAYNKMWWANPFIPDGWQSIKPIDIKR